MSAQILDTAAKHPFSLAGLVDRTWNAVSEAVFRATPWGPLGRMAETMVLSVMQKIILGRLCVLCTDGRTYLFPENRIQGSDGGDVEAEIRIKSDTFWIRLCLMGDLGFAEAYMYGEVECDDLVSLFKVFLMNKDNLDQLDSKLSYLFTLPQKLTSYRFLNTLSNSRSNISAHYDISNEMFAGFLSSDMTYSCAIFPDLDGDLNPAYRTRGAAQRNKRKIPTNTEIKPYQLPSPPASETFGSTPVSNSSPPPGSTITLESTSSNVSEALIAKLEQTSHEDHSPHHAETTEDESSSNWAVSNEFENRDPTSDDELHIAQLRKLDHIIAKLKIPANRPIRILEIGSGWGSMAIRIAQNYPLATIDTLTLSIQQQELARERIRSHPGLEERIRVHLMDYRAMPHEWKGAFDRVVSVEMIEAVGKEFLEEYWRVVDWAMKEKEAVGVVQVITIPEARFDKYVGEIDFIRKWVSCIPLSPFRWNSRLPVPLMNQPLTIQQIFPGGLLPTVSLLIQSLTAGSQGRLVVDSVSNIGPHYSRTLREWRRRFVDKFDSVIRPSLAKEYPDVMGGKDPSADGEAEVFKRKWIYYYCYCEVGFTTRTLGDHIIAFAREGYQDYGCNVFH